MSLLVYSASAGSGKTYTLALKYLSLALQSAAPNAFAGILAVTFTNKATGEMKDRILGQLYNLANGGLDAGFLSLLMQETGLGKEVLVQRAEAALQAIMHDYDHFRVETIDSFFQSLLQNLAHELKLTRGFRVDLDDQEVISQAVDRLLLTLDDPARRHKRGDLMAVVADFMKQNIEDDKGWNIAKDLKAFARKNLFCDTYMKHDAEIERVTGDARLMQELSRDLRQCIRRIEAEMDEAAQALKEIAEEGVAQGLKAGSLATFAKVLLQKEYHKEGGSTVQKALSDAGTLLRVKDRGDAALEGLASEVRERLSAAEELRSANARLYNSCQLTLENLEVLKLLGAIGREVTALTSENGSFLLAKTPELFSNLVQGTDASFVFERTGTSFRYMMIDEFQDTSHMQWDNFRKLLVENISKGGECMLVGDVKQSIYRWRGGDWDILFRIDREFKNVQMKTLGRNFRSKQTVVNFNNAFFVKAATLLDGKVWDVPADWATREAELVTPEMLERSSEDADGGEGEGLMLRLYKDVQQEVKPGAAGGYVRVALVEAEAEKDEILEEMYEQMLLLHETQHVPFGNMGVLVRANSEAGDVIDYFSAHHPEIPITSDVAFKYAASPMVMTLVSALKTLDDEKDTVSRELFKDYYQTLRQAVSPECAEQFAERQTVFLERVSDTATREQWRRMPLFELCHHVAGLLGFEELEREGHGGQSAYLYSFMDAVLDYLNDNPSDLSAFLVFWNDVLQNRAIATSALNAVYVITVHKAKGLQMHSVFIPFGDFQFEKDAPDSYIWCEPREEVLRSDALRPLLGKLPLVPVKTRSSTRVKCSVYEDDYLYEHMQQRVDSLNTLYVAFTRAESNLLIWSRKGGANSAFYLVDAFVNNRQPGFSYAAAKAKDKDGKSERFVPSVFTFGSPEKFTSPKAEKSSNPFETRDFEKKNVTFASGDLKSVSFRQSNQARQYLAETGEQGGEAESLAVDSRRAYIDRGLLLHKLFSLIRTRADVGRAVRELTFCGLLATEAEATEMRTLAERALSHPIASAWFDGHYRVFAECNLLLKEGGGFATVRPDRVMAGGGETIVVDYKFGEKSDAYETQVRRYMNLLRDMGYPNLKGYLWYVLDGEVKEVAMKHDK